MESGPLLLNSSSHAGILRYGFEWDRDYLVDIVFRVNSILPVLASLTVYPANFYLLLVQGPAMSRSIRAAYMANLISHIYNEWIFAFYVRLYTFPPYGLYYCEGIICKGGQSKPLIMGLLASGIMFHGTSFYVLMVRVHQMTVATSRWRLSWQMQLVIYLTMAVCCALNVAGNVIFGTDVENYDELVKVGPCFTAYTEIPDAGAREWIQWILERGGTVLLFKEPGKTTRYMIQAYLLLATSIFFIPLIMLFIVHALIYLRKKNQISKSSKTQLLTRRLFETFISQLQGSLFFFIIPLGVIITTSVVDVSEYLSGLTLAAFRFLSIVLIELDSPQLALVFILLNTANRQFVQRRILKIKTVARLLNWARTHPISEKFVIQSIGKDSGKGAALTI